MAMVSAMANFEVLEMEEIKLNECCKQDENLQIKFVWMSRHPKLEGDYEPIGIVCAICGTMVKEF
jgi:hypothetical protein